LVMRIQRIGIEGVSDTKSPRQLLGHFPCVLRIQVEIQEVERFVWRRGESFRRRGRDSVDVLRQGGVGDGRDRSLAEVEVVQAKNPRIGSEAQLVRPDAPCKIVVDEKPRGAPSLHPRVVQAADRGEGRIRAAALQNNRECGEGLLKIDRREYAPLPGKCRVEIIHEILREDMRISRRKRVQGLRRKSVEQRIDGIGVGGLESVVRLKAKPRGVVLIEVVIDSDRLHLLVIVA
jgi:hypothetical protein